MKIEKGVISSTQLMFLIIGLIQGSTLTIAFVNESTEQNTWIAVVVSFIIMCFLLLIYNKLFDKFPEKNIIEINDIIYGKYLGKIISVIYIYYFWLVIPSNIRILGDFFNSFLMQETDILVFIIVIGVACIYVVRKGLEVIANMVPMFAVITIIVAVSLSIMLVNEMDVKNLMPFLQLKAIEFIQGVNIIVAIPFGELIVFFMFYPSVKDKNNIRRYSFWGFYIGAGTLLLVSLRNILVLGSIGGLQVQASYQVAKIINIGEIITRMEVLIAALLLTNVFIKIAIFCYATSLSIAQIFNMGTYKHVVSPIMILSMLFSVTMFDSTMREYEFAANLYPIFGLIPQVVFPIISLIIAKAKNVKVEKFS
ncbi:endospore germination permease [Clostridium sp. YIM B02505]|uniref:Endospore germination permease n=1 Tax=Clostridium yunnanense TaxID=2800325 RepID=A0ABS1EQ61_9CLOT|nr:endospore germination permease [Clostridium yunnanense]MBK1811480.1 endospore germination permease [Clostridium yunnanense]